MLRDVRNGDVIIGLNERCGRYLEDQIPTTSAASVISLFALDRLRGRKGPLLIDNAALHYIFEAALAKIGELEIANQLPISVVETIRDPSPTVFKLTDNEIKDLLEFAYKVQQSKSWTKKMSIDHLYAGLAGEYAYSLYRKIPMNKEIFTDSGDGGFDFPGVQVKTVCWMGKNKQLKISRPLVSSVKTLVLAHFNMVEHKVSLIGEISVDRFWSICQENNRHGYSYVNESQLTTKYDQIERL